MLDRVHGLKEFLRKTFPDLEIDGTPSQFDDEQKLIKMGVILVNGDPIAMELQQQGKKWKPVGVEEYAASLVEQHINTLVDEEFV